MTDWIVSSNSATFDVDRAFMDRDQIDWSEARNAHLQAGDRVFLYQVRPVSAITHVCTVTRTGIPSSDMLDDREYWGDPNAFSERQDRTWMRLRGIRAFEAQERSLLAVDRLRDAGMPVAPQGRRRAPAGVSALVDQVLATVVRTAEDLISQEQELLRDLGYPNAHWSYARGNRGGMRSYRSYDDALNAPAAAQALALLRAYLRAADLVSSSDYAVSALPTWSAPKEFQRFATVNGSHTELFYVWLHSDPGTIESWGIRLPGKYKSTFSLPAGIEVQPTDTNDVSSSGDVAFSGQSLDQLLQFLDHQDVLQAVRTTAGMRVRQRRLDLHNPYLGALLTSNPEYAEPIPDPSSEYEVEIERRYIERVARTRLHQAQLRREALRHFPHACHFCGLGVVEVLDAAHLVPDRQGGAASMRNVRLLCANHHRAFDRGLLAWDEEADQFQRAEHAASVPPLPNTEEPSPAGS